MFLIGFDCPGADPEFFRDPVGPESGATRCKAVQLRPAQLGALDVLPGARVAHHLTNPRNAIPGLPPILGNNLISQLIIYRYFV